MSEPPSSESLLARIAARDERALLELWARHAPWLLGMVSRVTSDPRKASHVVDDTFAQLWNTAAHFPGADASVAAWLVMTARLRAIEQRHTGQSASARVRDPFIAQSGSFSWLPRPAQVALIDERRELLKRVVEELPKPQRAALDLAVFGGLSEEEIARKLGEPLGRVQSALRAAMRFIRHRMRTVLGTWSASL